MAYDNGFSLYSLMQDDRILFFSATRYLILIKKSEEYSIYAVISESLEG